MTPGREKGGDGPSDTTGRITGLLTAWRAGNQDAHAELIALLTPELHALAERHLGAERRDHTLQATALVNEAYLRLVAADVDWQDRIHFLAVASRTMRSILVDYARARAAGKRGGGAAIITLRTGDEATPDSAGGPDGTDLLDLDAAMNELAEYDAEKAQIIELHYFGGLTHREIADVVGASPATVDRSLRFSRAWLKERLSA